MIRPNALSLSPNTEFDDVILAVKVLLNPFLWRSDKFVFRFEKQFEKIFDGTYRATAINSGRSALQVILRAFDLPKGGEVILQAFTCVVVPNAILSNNLKPVYGDIDDSYNLDPIKLRNIITPETRVVIVQHTFGIPADMVAIKKVIKEKEATYKIKIHLVEDCAHSLGSKYKNKMIGTMGDVSFFSFGRDKILSSVFGGMIVTKDKQLVSRVKTIVSSLKTSSHFWIFQQLMHPILFNWIIMPLYNVGFGKVTLGKSLLLIFQKLHLLSKPVYPNELKAKSIPLFPQKMSGALALLGTNQLKKLKKFTELRRKVVSMYRSNDINPIFERAEDAIFLRYPLSVEKPARLHALARNYGVVLGNWYHEVLDPMCNPADFGYRKGSCPYAEKLARSIVNLPTYPTMKQSDFDTVIRIVKEWKNTL